MITKYETPSAAPSNPNGPGGSPQDVVFKMYVCLTWGLFCIVLTQRQARGPAHFTLSLLH